jgi:hypothetical protein
MWLGAIVQLVNGLHRTKKEIQQKEGWFRLIMSIVVTSFVGFSGMMGITIWSLYDQYGAIGSLVLGFASGLIWMAVTTVALWKRSPMTRGMSIVVPGKIEEKVLEASVTYTEKGDN